MKEKILISMEMAKTKIRGKLSYPTIAGAGPYDNSR